MAHTPDERGAEQPVDYSRVTPTTVADHLPGWNNRTSWNEAVGGDLKLVHDSGLEATVDIAGDSLRLTVGTSTNTHNCRSWGELIDALNAVTQNNGRNGWSE